jgi:hypothetical protein
VQLPSSSAPVQQQQPIVCNLNLPPDATIYIHNEPGSPAAGPFQNLQQVIAAALLQNPQPMDASDRINHHQATRLSVATAVRNQVSVQNDITQFDQQAITDQCRKNMKAHGTRVMQENLDLLLRRPPAETVEPSVEGNAILNLPVQRAADALPENISTDFSFDMKSDDNEALGWDCYNLF